MKKFVGDTLVFLSVVLGIATVYWLWSWNWFFAIIIGLFVFAFLCNIGAELSPPEPQEKISTNDKQVDTNKQEFAIDKEVEKAEEVEEKVKDIKADLNKQLDDDEVLNSYRQAMIHNIALFNLGIERYGMPTITYGGRKYTAKALHSFVINKNYITDDEKVMCKMMAYKINEVFDRLTTRDEDGYINKHTGDEVLDKYLVFLSTWLYTFERVSK